jgi:hypothetical protein
MKQFGWIVCGWVMVAGVLFAETGEPLAPAACETEMTAIRGVWRSPQVFAPLYADWDTVAYLATLSARATGGRPPVAVLPVYSDEPVHFSRGGFVFLSTALIVGAHSEQELIDAIQTELQGSRSKKQGWPSACVAVTPGPITSFLERQQRLADQVTEYAKMARPRLKRREEFSQITINR